MIRKITTFLSLIVAISLVNSGLLAADKTLWIQSTTSTRDSGLYKYLLPFFERDFQIKTYVIAVGTGQAIENAKNCDGDVLIVHSKDQELKFVKDGYGSDRYDLMFNDFVIIGPSSNPANINTTDTISSIFSKIANSRSKFISRGDDSGTHLSELKLWNIANLDPLPFSGKWYLNTGQGMGSTLNIAIGMDGYTLTDRSTWVRYSNKKNHLILYENNPNLFNQYGIIKINKKHCKDINHNAARIFIDWILSKKGQDLIGSYKLNDNQLFTPNYDSTR